MKTPALVIALCLSATAITPALAETNRSKTQTSEQTQTYAAPTQQQAAGKEDTMEIYGFSHEIQCPD